MESGRTEQKIPVCSGEGKKQFQLAPQTLSVS